MLLNWPQLEDRFKSDFGSGFVLHEATPVTGGDINTCFHLDTNQGPLFAKLNTPDKYDMFKAEVVGLEELGKCDALVVPQAITHGQNATVAFLCMTWLDLQPQVDQAALGEAIAALHEPIGQRFGAEANNFIGTTVQHNGWSDNWSTFFWERRLEPQLHLMLESDDSIPESALDPLKAKVVDLLEQQRYSPSLVHGDLWSGNVGTTEEGKPAVFDPAVYWGHAETDLAMARLFGGFSPEFFDAYEAVYPALDGEDERLLVYQLYHLLNHSNLFGGQYLDKSLKQISRILAG